MKRPTTTYVGHHAVQTALQNNNLEHLKKILQNVDVTITGAANRNYLMLGCSYSSSPEAMKLVLDKIGDARDRDLIKRQLTATDSEGWNCLMVGCCNCSSREAMNLVLEKIVEVGGRELLKNQLSATDNDGLTCLMLTCRHFASPEVMKLLAVVLFHFDLFKQQYSNLDSDSKKRLKEKTNIELSSAWNPLSSSWKPHTASLAEVKEIVEGGDARKKAEEQAAAKKKAEEEAAAKKRAEEQAAAKKKAEEEAAAKKKAEEQAVAKKKAEEEAAAKKRAEEEAAAKKRAEEQAAAKKKAEEEAAAKKEAEEQAVAKKKAEEQAVAKKKAEEEAAAKKRAEEEAAAKKKADEEAALAKKKAQEEAAAKKKAEEATLAKKKAEEEAAAKKKVEEEAAAKKKGEEEAALAAKKKAHDEEPVLAKKKADENAVTTKKAQEEAVTQKTSETRSSPFGIPRVNKGELGIDFSSTPIGSGATCSVYSCRYFHTVCAAKIFQSHITSDRVVQREMNAAVHLKHPNIVNVLAIIVDDNDKDKIIGILMQRMNGTLLQRVINTSPYEDAAPPTTSDLIKWCCQTASAILCAHSLKCIHCDIKPENVMLDQQDNAYLTDFGSAHVMTTAATKVTNVRGTALYIAPEYAALDVEEPNEKTDVFSFGMLMWVVFHPKDDHRMGKSDMQIGRSLDKGKRPEISNKDLPTEIISLIKKCWHEDADERPDMADVLTVFNEVIANIEESEKGADFSTFKLTPSPLWTDARYLKTKYGAIAEHLSSLKWSSPENAPSLHFSEDITDKNSPLVKFIEQKFRPSPGFKKAEENVSDTQFSGKFSRLQMVQPADAHSLFLALHEADGSSRFANSFLRHKNNSDSATQNALEKLRSVFEDPDCNPLTDKQNFSRILFGWHGTNAAIADLVCRDGPRSLRLTDAGFFGAGSYFSLEADYAANYAYMSNTNTKGEYAIILFAVSVSQTYPITLEHDYRSKEDANRPEMHGFSNFYNGPDPKKAIALAPKCDSHFIPVKKHGDGRQHPLGKYDTMNGNAVVEKDKTRVACNLDQQACDAKDPDVNGHELLILNHQRAVPVAVMYFK